MWGILRLVTVTRLSELSETPRQPAGDQQHEDICELGFNKYASLISNVKKYRCGIKYPDTDVAAVQPE